MTNPLPSSSDTADNAQTPAGPAPSAPPSPYRAADAGTPTPYPQPPFAQQSGYGQQQSFAQQSGYGQTQSYGQPVYGQQPPYGQAQYTYPPQQAPYPHQPVVARTSNGPGLAALIVGIVSMTIALFPTGAFSSALIGFVGVTLGIIGLVLPARPRRRALWGLILSGASIPVGMIMTFVYMFVSMAGYY